MTTPNQTTLQALKSESEIKQPAVVLPGFGSSAGMALLEQAATMLTFSDMVPEQYRSVVRKGNKEVQNPSGMSNCIVALNMATEIGINVLTVMQNMHVISGRPSWSAQFIIARANNCGHFSRLAFELSEPSEEIEVEYEAGGWHNGNFQSKKATTIMRRQSCRAYAKELSTGHILKGPEITVDMAIAEGWATKNGSKWHTMPELMLQYRAAAFWCRLNAPELLAGLPTTEELHDVLDAETVNGIIQVQPQEETATEPRTQRRTARKTAQAAPAAQEAEDVQMKGETVSSESKPDQNLPDGGESVPEAPESEPQTATNEPQQRGRGRQSQQLFTAE